MAGEEPAWFRSEPFCREVIYFSFRELGFFPPSDRLEVLGFPEDFQEAVRIVGKSVFCLQLIIRDKLRPYFIEMIDAIAGEANESIFLEVVAFMSQSYLHSDIFNFTLSCFAIVGELIVFMEMFELPLPLYFFPMPWCAIYEMRLKDQLASKGGWGELLRIAERRYIDSELYQEISLAYDEERLVPHGEVATLNNWPESPSDFMAERFDVPPPNTILAVDILDLIYGDEQWFQEAQAMQEDDDWA